jgi:3,4-dihydroxy-2-butanone 4-phosphate synthase
MSSDAIIFTPLSEAIERFKAGSFVVVMDDESRENEGTKSECIL